MRQKLTASKLLQSHLTHIKNVNLLFKTDLKSAELLTKTFFFLYFRGVLKIAKELSETSKVYAQD